MSGDQQPAAIYPPTYATQGINPGYPLIIALCDSYGLLSLVNCPFAQHHAPLPWTGNATLTDDIHALEEHVAQNVEVQITPALDPAESVSLVRGAEAKVRCVYL